MLARGGVLVALALHVVLELWDAFHHLGTTKAGLAVLENVDTIYLELHLSLQLSTADDLLKFATMYHRSIEAWAGPWGIFAWRVNMRISMYNCTPGTTRCLRSCRRRRA